MGVHALYTAATGMNAQMKQLEVTAKLIDYSPLDQMAFIMAQ